MKNMPTILKIIVFLLVPIAFIYIAFIFIPFFLISLYGIIMSMGDFISSLKQIFIMLFFSLCFISIFLYILYWIKILYRIISPEKFDVYINKKIEKINIKLIQTPQDADLYIKRAKLRFEIGDWFDALENCDIAIKLNPKKSQYYLYRAKIKKFLLWSNDAISDIDKALGIKKSLTYIFKKQELKNEISLSAKKIKKFSEELKGERDINTRVDIISSRASWEFKSEDYENAIKDYLRIIKIHKNDNIYTYFLVSLYIKLGNYDEAVSLIESFIKNNPKRNNYDYESALRYINKEKGKYKDNI